MKPLVTTTAVLAALTLAACGSSPVTIHGLFTVSSFSNDGSNCVFGEDSGYSDITPGTQVTVTAPDGTVLGSGSLGSPVVKNNGDLCGFRFTVRGVKGGEARYGISVSKRGTVWFSPSQVPHATLGLGD
jgi:hypothetical protein